MLLFIRKSKLFLSNSTERQGSFWLELSFRFTGKVLDFLFAFVKIKFKIKSVAHSEGNDLVDHKMAY